MESTVRIACFIIATALTAAACKGEPPVAQVLDSNSDKPSVVQFNGLFFKLIGRQVGRRDRSDIGGISKAQLEKKSYDEQIDSILQSEQFYREGFWHFHEDRLLLGKAVRDNSAIVDHEALKLEMEDVARSDNYWDIFTYSDRWLPLDGLQLNDCSDYLDSEPNSDYHDENQRRCTHFLQAVLHPEVEHRDNCIYYSDEEGKKARKFTDIYKDRCCSATEGSIAEQDTELCNRMKTDYEILFQENFCAVAAKPVIDSYCKKTGNSGGDPKELQSEGDGDGNTIAEALPFTWDKSNIYKALSLYISLHLSEGAADVFIEASIAPPKAEESIYRRGDEYESFIKVTLPTALQGIHASPYWLSTHYTSDNNQHLHRARIIYHSWFCEGISPNQAKKEGGKPDDTEQFSDYFPEGDKHAESHNNCYDCHKMIQPLANYFGSMSAGVRYEDGITLGLSAARFLQKETDGKKLPFPKSIGTGYYNPTKGEFFEWGHKQPGMAGLAELLSNLPKVKSCVVKYTWNKIFGCGAELSEKEISDATSYLPNYRALLKHLMMTEKAQAYFIPEEGTEKWNGEEILLEMVAEEREARRWRCKSEKGEQEEKLQEEEFADKHELNGESIANVSCVGCHSTDTRFFTTNTDGEKVFNSDIDPDFLKTIYLRSNSATLGPMMPQSGYQEIKKLDDDLDNWSELKSRKTNSREIQRNIFKCFIENKAAEMGVKLPELKSCVDIDHKKIHEIVRQP